MESKISNNESPDFSTLSGIMEYFHKVPFEVFKKELNEWFLKELPNKRPDLINLNGDVNLPPSFPNLISEIFKISEEKDQSNLN